MILNLITTLAIVVGVVFGLFELRQALQDRRNQAAVEVVGTYLTQEIRRAMALALTLPNDVDPSVVNDDPEMRRAALAVDSACEAWGSMVYEGLIDLHMFDRIAGGQVRGAWHRLHLWVQGEREATGNLNSSEWWQWLYERLEADPDPGKAAGAYVSHRGKNRR